MPPLARVWWHRAGAPRRRDVDDRAMSRATRARGVELGMLPGPGWDSIASFLGRRLLPAAEQLGANRYTRACAASGEAALLSVERAGDGRLRLYGS
jgi:hypothetical protein